MIRGKGRKIRFCPLWKKDDRRTRAPHSGPRYRQSAVSQPIRQAMTRFRVLALVTVMRTLRRKRSRLLKPSELARIRFAKRRLVTCFVPALISTRSGRGWAMFHSTQPISMRRSGSESKGAGRLIKTGSASFVSERHRGIDSQCPVDRCPRRKHTEERNRGEDRSQHLRVTRRR